MKKNQVQSDRPPGRWQAIREFLYGMFGLEFAGHAMEMRASLESLFMLGTVGDNCSLRPEEKRKVLSAAKEVVNGRIPILTGVAEFTTAEAAKNAIDRNKWRPPVVIKADGLAAGKGVAVCRTLDEARVALATPPINSGRVVFEELLEPLLLTQGVAVVFTGHEHFYERLKPQHGIHYFIAGSSAKLRRGNIEESNITAKGFDQGYTFMLVEIVGVARVTGDETIIAATRDARALLCSVDEINFLSGPGRGVILIKLTGEGDRVLGFIASVGDRDLMTVETSRGAEQTISTAKYEVTGRGGKGRELMQRGQFVRVVPQMPDAPPPIEG